MPVMGRRLLVATLLLLVLAAAFWRLDFRAARSDSHAQSQVTTIGGGRGGEPARPQDGLAIYVVGNGDLAKATAEGLARTLETSPGFGRIDVLGVMPQATGRPALVVEVEELDATWTPIYARARLVVTADYASDGDLSWRHQPTISAGASGPQVLLNGRVELSDVTWGITSRRAYDKALGGQVAAEVGKALAGALSNPAFQAPAALGSN